MLTTSKQIIKKPIPDTHYVKVYMDMEFKSTYKILNLFVLCI